MHAFLVHGYLAPSGLLWPVSRGLRRAGFQTSSFDYPSRRGSLDEHARNLAQYVEDSGCERFGFVGHSMGGLVIRRALEFLGRPADRVVFISTPHRGCALGKLIRRSLIGGLISDVARSTAHGLTGDISAKAVGVIAGSRDRTVKEDEAYLDGAEALLLPYGHNEILFRPKTANAVVRFFQTAHFEVEVNKSAFYEQLSTS